MEKFISNGKVIIVLDYYNFLIKQWKFFNEGCISKFGSDEILISLIKVSNN
jgi:hypothetical protein